jgi:hypothetical protein
MAHPILCSLNPDWKLFSIKTENLLTAETAQKGTKTRCENSAYFHTSLIFN